ncbi:hypothetical protein CROQUDRAFT_94376 [Cronartium quercuum f. sp. fusiforme G11]|uniref:Uncharacterized protein n=1 Tax=Cronartium quercuum f. sp. fusiforme G11 TaxID=708437 RepID=A0A9P6NFD7_9BASI|nr:hypothetical protein CROQUDRAFT_94376 [Cronartium quercuum f. sp. fusiforme G11]
MIGCVWSDDSSRPILDHRNTRQSASSFCGGLRSVAGNNPFRTVLCKKVPPWWRDKGLTRSDRVIPDSRTDCVPSLNDPNLPNIRGHLWNAHGGGLSGLS